MEKIFLILFIVFLTSCSIVEIQPTSTPTQNPTPTSTLIPTATINPCSDEGWSEISIYLNQFERVKDDMQVGDSIAAVLEQFENIKNEVSNVQVAACTEYAKQTILKGLNTQILGFYSLFVEKDYDNFADYFLQGNLNIKSALDELRALGIEINLE